MLPSATRQANSRTNPSFALMALAAITLVVSYASVAASIVETWSTNPLFSYGFAVPLISSYIVWTRWPQVRTLQPSPDYRFGVPVTLVAAAMLAIGKVGAFGALEGVSLVVAIAGLVLLLFGRQVFAALWFPIAYLLLMVPVWHDPISRLQEPSQIISGRIAVAFLRVAGIPAFQQGTILTLPNLTLEVLRECSGVNQLVALLAMVIPVAYLWIPTPLRRAILVVFAVAVGYLGNGFRIALVGWLGVKGLGDGNPQSPVHLMQGLVVSLLGYLLIGAMVSVLARTKTGRPNAPARQVSPGDVSSLSSRRPWLEYAVLTAVLFAAGVQVLSARLEASTPTNLQSLPTRLGAWTIDITPDVRTLRLPDLDDELLSAYPGPSRVRRFESVDDQVVRGYRSDSGARVQLYVGYYQRQVEGKELAGDAGHALHGVSVPLVLSGSDDTPVDINEVVQRQKNGAHRGLLYWYDVNGRTLRSIYAAKGYSMFDLFTRRRTNGAVVMVGWVSPAGQSYAQARAEAIAFAGTVLPALKKQLPS